MPVKSYNLKLLGLKLHGTHFQPSPSHEALLLPRAGAGGGLLAHHLSLLRELNARANLKSVRTRFI